MPVKVQTNPYRQPNGNCVFCKKPTRFWSDIKNRSDQVPLCGTCAEQKDEEEVISYKEHKAREASRTVR